jgi:transcriptional regulator with XRE-family HTH domain
MAKHGSYTQWALEPYGIGMKLRALRNQKKMTLSRLAAETGLSTALLSKIETERMIPTLPTLAQICRVYGVNLSHFFSEPDRHVLAITRKAHLEDGSLRADPIKSVPLNAAQQNPRLIARMLELSNTPNSPEGNGEELCMFVHVLEGKLVLIADGLSQTLDTGDCAYMETGMPVSWRAGGDQRCRILLLQPAAGGLPGPADVE